VPVILELYSFEAPFATSSVDTNRSNATEPGGVDSGKPLSHLPE